ncbi:MAG: D-alanine--D-alanine ligase family protein [Actinomycetes bacterium]
MSKIKVGIVCGGKSSEHEISCISAGSLLEAIDREKFEPVLIGITRSGRWVLPDPNMTLRIESGVLPEIPEDAPQLQVDIAGISIYGQPLDIEVIFPVLHGPYGEDGTIQGFCEMAGLRYVGSGVLASAVAMDKSFAKPIFHAQGLKVADGLVIHQRQWESPAKERLLAQVKEMAVPLFVKPARSGSSRGTSKVRRHESAEAAIEFALTFDTKVLIEVAIIGREIECAVLQKNGEAFASPLGEIKILGSHEFYDFEAKYLDGSTELIKPEISEVLESRIQDQAVAAFNALGCEGLARVDFFLSEHGDVIINEINTMPGFTSTSVYPKLWDNAGLSYPNLISALIDEALWRSEDVTR